MHSEAESNEADAKQMLMTFSLTQTPNGATLRLLTIPTRNIQELC